LQDWLVSASTPHTGANEVGENLLNRAQPRKSSAQSTMTFIKTVVALALVASLHQSAATFWGEGTYSLPFFVFGSFFE
jgi:hypothetical protein